MAHAAGSILPDLAGRRALVTGGANGIGRACAERLARAGATVVVADLDGEAAERTAAAIGGEPVQIDLSRLDTIVDLGGDFDIVVNNAGLQHISSLVDFPEERFSLILRVMLEAPFRIIRQTLPHMYAGGWGRIVNISSVHGLVASPFKSAYVTAKHGLEGLSKATALESAAHGVTSNCINPGFVRTALVEKQIADQAEAHGMSQDQMVPTSATRWRPGGTPRCEPEASQWQTMSGSARRWKQICWREAVDALKVLRAGSGWR